MHAKVERVMRMKSSVAGSMVDESKRSCFQFITSERLNR